MCFLTGPLGRFSYANDVKVEKIVINGFSRYSFSASSTPTPQGLFVPAMEALRTITLGLHLLEGEDEFMFSCAYCRLGIMETIFRYGNHWALVQQKKIPVLNNQDKIRWFHISNTLLELLAHDQVKPKSKNKKRVVSRQWQLAQFAIHLYLPKAEAAPLQSSPLRLTKKLLPQPLSHKLASAKFLNLACKNETDSELKKWELRLSKIRKVRTDAEEKQLTNQAMKIWRNKLRDLAYDVEDVLEEFETEARYRGCRSRIGKMIPT
ncbi:unnamed protein product [Dovyalis caffra]|uniref:Disease resistance N-terminal domain-containing protein n=1 Tax=Dovyalis caffra TaxID=77055 RepID=A0AAV1RD13_9ROSI|nr:unnamed protein product [Dovyalis caffra]